MKDILMVVHTMGSLEPSDNDRFTYIAKELVKSETCNVEIITSDFEHHKKRQRNLMSVYNYPFKLTFLHERPYRKNVSLSRVIGHTSFAVELKKYLKCRTKPDVIYLAVPPLESATIIADYAHKNGIKLVIDVQDLWPESFEMILGKNIFSRVILSPLTVLANNIYKKADVVFSVSDTFFKYIESKRKNKTRGSGIYLGVDSNRLNTKMYSINKPSNEKWIVYVGNLATSYDFDNVFLALKQLNDKGYNNFKFIILGDGDRKLELIEKGRQYKLNMMITGYLPYEQMFSHLLLGDIALNPIIKTSVSSVINKVGDYAAAGIPVVNSQNSDEYRTLLEEYEAGLNAIPEDSDSIAEKIEMLLNDEDKAKTMGMNNRRLYENRFNRRNSYKSLIHELID